MKFIGRIFKFLWLLFWVYPIKKESISYIVWCNRILLILILIFFSLCYIIQSDFKLEYFCAINSYITIFYLFICALKYFYLVKEKMLSEVPLIILLKEFFSCIFTTFVLGISFIIIIIFSAIYDEWERSRLLTAYEVPSEFIKKISDLKSGKIADLLKEDETIICAMNSEGRASDLHELNKKQIDSLPKRKIPSEDLAWYLLFFKKDAISRIYLFDEGRWGFFWGNKGYACLKSDANYFILENKVYHTKEFIEEQLKNKNSAFF